MSNAYRIDWWVALPSEPGEWAGRWDLAPDAVAAKAVAATALAGGCALGLVRLTLPSPVGEGGHRVVVDAVALAAWAADVDRLPASGADAGSLPPRGRDDIEVMTLARCREALIMARDADLIGDDHVAAIVEIVQQAFSGTGPAVDVVALMRGVGAGPCGR